MIKQQTMLSKIHPSWQPPINSIGTYTLTRLEEDYNLKIQNGETIFPLIDNIFYFTYTTPFDNVRVVILGQDPYHGTFINNYDELEFHQDSNNETIIKKTEQAQATGLSFSVPNGCKLPPTLINIFKNQKKFNQITNIPTSGNLEKWAKQGVLLLNTALTVKQGEADSHKDMWKSFTNKLLSHLTQNKVGLIFALFGGNAIDKKDFIFNADKQFFTISSHPSPLGASQKIVRKQTEYGPFNDTNHFGNINDFIKNNGLGNVIDWNLN